jgi:insertion element IS1 protein InsB
MKCKYCQGACVKKGCYKNRQLYRCKACFKYQRKLYVKHKITASKIDQVKSFVCEGLSISSISRLLNISKSSVQRKIIYLASMVKKPHFTELNQEYEVDELHTYIGNKQNTYWVIYAMNKHTKQVIDLVVGKRTKANISQVIQSLKKLNPSTIFTDKLNIYPSLIKPEIHVSTIHKINSIERKNLNLRKDIKCLNRKTICYSKSVTMLAIILMLYIHNK